jgi:hypothetical protein
VTNTIVAPETTKTAAAGSGIVVGDYDFDIPIPASRAGLMEYFAAKVQEFVPADAVPLRFVVSETTSDRYRCELASISGLLEAGHPQPESIFRFCRRKVVNNEVFNVAFIVPTGIGAEIGGHVGDGAPVARMLAAACDTLILHPNVVNAADINEMPANSLYVEGSVLARMLMGTVGLQRVRSNRILVVIEESEEQCVTDWSINAVNAAVASAGFGCTHIVRLGPPFTMTAAFTASGRAAGRVGSLERLIGALSDNQGRFDAIALTSLIDYPSDATIAYYEGASDSVNPWGGVEAMLTHAVSTLFNVPSAHSPQVSPGGYDYGIGHPTMAAELVSVAYLHCVLKGLHQSPKLVTDPQAMNHHAVLTAADVSCLVMPDRCLGLPTLAALEQGIPVIAVRDRANQLRNDISSLPWAPGQLMFAENYYEAAGFLCALRSGMALQSACRPLLRVSEERHGSQ